MKLQFFRKLFSNHNSIELKYFGDGSFCNKDAFLKLDLRNRAQGVCGYHGLRPALEDKHELGGAGLELLEGGVEDHGPVLEHGAGH